MPKASVALSTLVSLLLGRWRDVGRVVVEVLMPLEQLLLPEALVTLVALIRLLVRVDQHVALQVTLGNRAVRAEVTLETLLSLVGLLVHFQSVPVMDNSQSYLANCVLSCCYLSGKLLPHILQCIGFSLVWSFWTWSLKSVFLPQVVGQSSH